MLTRVDKRCQLEPPPFETHPGEALTATSVEMLYSTMQIKGETTLTSKGQMTVPKRIQERLGLRAGDQLEVEIEDVDTLRFRVRRRSRTGSLL